MLADIVKYTAYNLLLIVVAIIVITFLVGLF